MNGDLLIVYATRYGSTRDAAGLLRDVLKDAGFGTDLRRARDMRTLEGVGAVVLAAPFYIGRLHRDAEAFLAAHREALAARPTAIAAFGPLGAGKAEDRDQLEATLGRHPELKPVSAGMFGGSTIRPSSAAWTACWPPCPRAPFTALPPGTIWIEPGSGTGRRSWRVSCGAESARRAWAARNIRHGAS